MDAGKTRDLLRQIVLGNNTENGSLLCKVVSVDDSKFTCVVSKVDNEEIQIENVLLSVNDTCLNVLIPTVDSKVIISPFQGGYYVAMFSEIKQVYSATIDESILDIMKDFITAIKAIQLLHPQGSTVANGVINVNDFIDIENRLKKFYLK
jgi:hypothetical protein